MKAVDLKVGDIVTKLGTGHLVGQIVNIVGIKGKMITVHYKPLKMTKRFKNEKIDPDEVHRAMYNINTPLENILYK